MQKILKWFAPGFTLGVAIFIIFFIISINSHQHIEDLAPLELETEVREDEVSTNWLNHFSESQRLGYFYPINEVYIKLDLDEKITKKTIYKLSASILDPYQLFCLKEELSHHGLKYSLKSDDRTVELLIFSKDIKRLNSLVKVLKNYQILATIKPYKEDV